ncbi:hypothetical protein CLU79DRAFT_753390 [Phycomyces nitens]|nr:hypothetical protein CLU79DRAFT_753390 [Phycomyces nitens]
MYFVYTYSGLAFFFFFSFFWCTSIYLNILLVLFYLALGFCKVYFLLLFYLPKTKLHTHTHTHLYIYIYI